MKKLCCIIFVHVAFFISCIVTVAVAEISSYDFQMKLWQYMTAADVEGMNALVKNNPTIAVEALKLLQQGGESDKKQAKLYGQMALLLNALIKGEDVKITQKVKPEKKAYVEQLQNLLKAAKTAEQSGNLKEALSLSEAALELAEKDSDHANIIVFLNIIGIIHEAMVMPEKALPCHERALKLAREIKNSKAEQESLRYSALIQDHLGNKDKALEYLKQALKSARQTGDSGSECETLLNFGVVYMNSGLNRKAMQYFEQAFKLSKELGASDAITRSMVNLGAVYNKLGLTDKALSLLKEADKITRDNGDPEVSATILINLGSSYVNMDQYETARSYFMRALLLCRKTGDQKIERTVANNLGIIEMRLGHYESAMQNLQLAAALIRKVGGLREMAYVLLHMGLIHKILGQPDRALKLFILALKLFHDKKDIAGMSAVMSNIGVINKRKGDFEKALGCFKEALQYNEATGDIKGRSVILTNIGVIYDAQKKTQQAMESFKLALEIDNEIGDLRGAGLIHNNMGLGFLKQKEYIKAQKAYEDSLHKFEAAGADDLLWHAYSGLGATAAARQRPDEALAFYQKAFESIEALKTGLNVDPAKLSFMRDKFSVYDEAILFMTDCFRKTKDNNYAIRAFNIFERKQGRLFAEAIGRAGAVNFAGVPDEIHKAYDNSVRRLKAYQATRNSEFRKARVDRLRRLDQLITDQNRKSKALNERIKKDYPAFHALIHPQPVSLKTLQCDVLRADEMILIYAVMYDRIFLWAVSQDTFRIFTIDRGIRALDNDVIRFRQNVINLSEDTLRGTIIDRTGHTAFENGDGLSDLLLPEELLAKLRTMRMLYIVPTGPLYLLPFEALTLPQSGGTKRFLIETHAVAYLSSASLLQILRRADDARKEHPQHPLLAFANPVYNAGSTSTPKKRKKSGFIRTSLRKQLGNQFTTLPETEWEVDAIKTILQAPDASTPLYLKESASRSTVLKLHKQGHLKNYRYVIFACHSVLPGRVERVCQPSLVLSDPDPETGGDGFLTMTDVFDLRFNADLVVLAACETGRGGLVRGEGVMGLTRAFMYAGASSVAVTLWAVESASAGALNIALFKNLAQGMTRAEALRHAKLGMISGQEGERYRHPCFWAPLVLFGEGR